MVPDRESSIPVEVYRRDFASLSVAPSVSRISQWLSRRPSPESIKQNLERDPDLLAIDDAKADEIFAALSSATARSILTVLFERPRTASELADEADTSVQNVSYHLDNLRESDLVEVVETWYSDQGKEMKVYAPANEALVLFAGDEISRSSFFDAVKRLVGFVGLFGLLGVIAARLARRSAPSGVPLTPGAGQPDSEPIIVTVPPGVLFFFGSVLALLVIGTWLYYRRF